MRLCLFTHLKVRELYEGGGSNRCSHLSWTEIEICGDQWIIAECDTPGKRKQMKCGKRTYNVCTYRCKKRISNPVRGFFIKISKLIREWERARIYDQLTMLEERIQQRSVGPYLISM